MWTPAATFAATLAPGQSTTAPAPAQTPPPASTPSAPTPSAPAQPAPAQSTPGQPRRVPVPRPPVDVEVGSVKFVGVSAVSTGALKGALATQAGSRLPWGENRYFDEEEFAADLRRVHAFYADNGYPRARVVDHELNYNDDRSKVDVVIHVEEGPPVRIGAISFFGFEALPANEFTALQRGLPIQVGQVRRQADLVAARDQAAGAFKEYGHPYVRIQMLEGSGREPDTVTLTLAAEAGRAAKFGPVEIVGNSSVSDEVIRRYLAFAQGDTFKLSRILISERRLYNLEVFQFVNFDLRGMDTQPEDVPVRVTVTEGKHRRVEFGLGYGSEEHARARVNWRHVNFFGGARTAGVEAKYSSLEQGVRLNFTEPYFFSPTYTFDVSVQEWHANEPAFDLRTRGGRVTVSREIRRRRNRRRASTTRASVTLVHEYERYTISPEALADLTFRDELIALGLDPRTGEGRGTLGALSFNLTHDTTTNRLDPRNGFLGTLHVERAGGVLPGDFEYWESTVEMRHYIPIGSRIVWANKGRIGSIDGSGNFDETVPFFKRYFLGGSTSLRGWSRFEVSPLSGSGLPLGGFAVLELSSELRFPVWRQLSSVLFVDAGNVWDEPWRHPLNDLRYDAGTGVRYNTPIGPIRLDVGYQLNPVPGLLIDGEPQRRRWRLHFSIGQAF